MKAVSKGAVGLSMLMMVGGCGGTALWEDIEAGDGGSAAGGTGAHSTGALGGNLGGRTSGGGGWQSGGGTGGQGFGGIALGGAYPVGGRMPLGGWAGSGGWVPTGGYSPSGGLMPMGGGPVGGAIPVGGGPLGGSVPAGGSPVGGFLTGGIAPVGGWVTGGVPPVGGRPTGGSGGIQTGGTGGTLNECVLDYQSTGWGYCEMQYTCPNDWVWLSCYGEVDYTYCDCSSDMDMRWITYELEGTSTANACGIVDDLCIGGGEIQFTDPPVCSSMEQGIGPGYCYASQECTQKATVADGVSVVSRTWKDTSCNHYSDYWSCYCNGYVGSMSFDLPDSLVADSACNSAARICDGGAIETTGPRECTPTFRYASPESCDSELDCARDATVGGQPIQVHEWLYTNCWASSTGWTCDCQGGSGNVSFDLGDDVDSWNACDLAGTRCAEVLPD